MEGFLQIFAFVRIFCKFLASLIANCTVVFKIIALTHLFFYVFKTTGKFV